MAKNTGADDHAKVKVRVIEFELEGGNATVENSIRQLTTALTNRTVGPKLPPPKTPKELHAGNGAETIEEPENDVLDTQFIENDDAPPAKKPSRPKKAPKPPTYLPELAAKIGAFKDFAKEKAPTTKTKQYLVAAYWLKEHGGNDTVNADKIYTCFKTAGWSTGFNDWAQTFHNLVHTEHMRKTGNTGEFAVNPLGEDAVTKGTDA
jgi:hypothetical protein